MQFAVKNYLASVLARLWAPYCYRLWAAKLDCCSESDSALSAAVAGAAAAAAAAEVAIPSGVVFSAAEAAAAASSAAVAAAVDAVTAVYFLYFCVKVGSSCVSMVQDHAKDCGLSYTSAVAGYKKDGSKLWRTGRLGGVSMATALRALIKCDFSVRAACHEIGGDRPLAPDLQKFLRSPTVVVDGQQLSRFEVRDKEVLEAEVMDELVCTFVQDVRRACS